MSGKGSGARPFEIPREEFAEKWEAIFGPKKKKSETIEITVKDAENDLKTDESTETK